jgi:phosphoesterase RecJ-like protein
MKIKTEIKNILDLMRWKKRFLITSHKDPDGDSIGSQLALYYALKQKGKQVHVVNQGGLPEKYGFLDNENVVVFSAQAPLQKPEAVFILECPALERIGFVSDLIPKSSKVINIDHHLDNQEYGDINWVDAKSCAVGELVYNLLDSGGYEITPTIARDLYAAIICDTGNFRFASTTARGMKIAAKLVEKGAKPKLIFDQIFSKASPATLRLLGLTLESLNVMSNGKISYLTVSRDIVSRAKARIEDSEGFVDYALAVAGVRMGILFKEMGEEEVKVSIRSQNGINAVAFARSFDGGGHVNAAGFTLHGKLKEIIREVVGKAEEYVNSN